jgi:hypothetical protein
MLTDQAWWDELFDGGKDVLAYLAGAERFRESNGCPENGYYDIGIELEFFMDECKYVINFDYCRLSGTISYFKLTIFGEYGGSISIIALSKESLIRHIKLYSGKTLSFP